MSVKDSSDQKSLVKGNIAFACDLYQQLKKTEGNIFFSPYSISTALAMTYAGARKNTATEMAQTLHFDQLGQAGLHPAFAALEAALQVGDEAAAVEIYPLNAHCPLPT